MIWDCLLNAVSGRMQNIRDKEAQLLGKMLNLASSSASSALVDFNDQWKVLIYDQDGRDIISPLLSVPALRQKGVTLHLLLHSEREPVPDAPAVYFVRPTEENLKRIADDCAKQLYRTAYLHFITRVDRPVLEKFAQDLVATNSSSMISKIYDQYLDVIALEPGLFTLNIKDAFAMYNEPSLNEQHIRSFMNRVAVGLLSTVRVMGTLPIIRAPPGGAAEMLAVELNNTLKENISSRGPAQALFEDCLVHDRSRPLLVILERSSDLFPVLQHNSTYQALIGDLLDFKLNRVTVEVNDKASSSIKKKTYDLNVATDNFFNRFAGAPFPEAVEAYEKELNEVSQKEAAIRSRPDFAKMSEEMIPGGNGSSGSGGIDSKSKDLSEALENLPEILHRKALLEAHTNVMQNVMKKIASREIPTFFEFEQNLLTHGSRGLDKAAALALLKDGSKGSLLDKTRLLALIAVTILSSGVSGAEANMDEYDAAFTQGCQSIGGGASGDAAASSGGNSPSSSSSIITPSAEEVAKALSSVQFIRRLLALQSSPMMRGFGGVGGGGGGGLSSFLNTATNRATSLISKAASFFTKFTPFYATRIVHSLAEGRGSPEEESFVYLDPRSRDPPSASAAASTKYSDVIVFVIGGGSYAEYFNLQELLREKASSSAGSLRSITYGCTDLVSGDEFVRQLEKLSGK